MLPINTYNYPVIANRYQSQLAFSSDKKNTDADKPQDSEKSEINGGFTNDTEGEPTSEQLAQLRKVYARRQKLKNARPEDLYDQSKIKQN
jgi:hypothetical protein